MALKMKSTGSLLKRCGMALSKSHTVSSGPFPALFCKGKTVLHNVSQSLCTTPKFHSKTKGSEISRFPVPPRESLPDDIQEVMKELEEKGGFVPNVHSALSHRPDEFRAFFNYYDTVMADRGNLTKADKEMIIVATSSLNKCLYCIIAHGALLRIYSKNPHLADQVAANWRTADLDPRQYAILEFAMDVARCEPLSEERFQNLEAHGLTREDAWDIGAVTALFALSNRMAFLANMKPNKEFYLLGRVPREKKKS